MKKKTFIYSRTSTEEILDVELLGLMLKQWYVDLTNLFANQPIERINRDLIAKRQKN